MPAILVAVDRMVRGLVDLHQARGVRVGGGHRVILQVTEAARKGRMFGAGDLLIA
ncbi:hypothetical protein D3C76_1528680 [compost metagenome]